MHILQHSLLNLRTFCYTLFATTRQEPISGNNGVQICSGKLCSTSAYKTKHCSFQNHVLTKQEMIKKSTSHVSLNKHNSTPLIAPYRILAIKTCVQLKMTKSFVQREKLKMQDHTLSNVLK